MSILGSHYFNTKIFIISLMLVLIAGCASMQTPQGGPRDTKPPKVLNMTPKNLTRNFSAKKIIIEFDEYFKLNDEFKEFSISPDQEQPPILTTRKKTLEIAFQDSLEKNTTYTLNFGKAIADINENNILKNLSYVFSTGDEIDSLSISGKVTSALSGETEKEASVFILPIERDTLFGKRRPSIYTLTDSSGLYKINNLRKGTYKVYALKEAQGGGDKIYQQLSDEVGFLNEPVVIDKNIENINLQVFKELAPEFRVLDRKLNNDGSISLMFNQRLKQPKITVMDPPAADVGKFVYFNKTNDTAKVWLNNLSFDSVKVALQEQGKVIQTVNFSRGKKDTYSRDLTITDNTAGGKLNPYQRYTLLLNFPITMADASKITLLEDSVKRTNFELIKDSVDFLKYYLKYTWKNKRTYDIKFSPGAFTGIFNVKNKEINKSFTLETTDSYGTLALNVTLPDTTKSYLVEFIDEKKNTIKSYTITKNGALNFANYPAGKYFVRVIYDENRNGIWDTGNVATGKQPEKIWYSPEEKSLRANWERVDNLTIPPPPKDE
ncbi:Ig-like domain-containing protein [Pedobacter sandarakinus]|uniref:Ig-like domain-containing protein n=1 Tax=Pedobacter sandarakinus TaxID=353156 RepID=UPI0022473279|nr:Ig-like domain-containing protein [Pedobacter sandarakinus]MCX2573752.1 Ig-like domain-containing protein [Pedobacter sandarakinus]